jgi:hypothetical protein
MMSCPLAAAAGALTAAVLTLAVSVAAQQPAAAAAVQPWCQPRAIPLALADLQQLHDCPSVPPVLLVPYLWSPVQLTIKCPTSWVGGKHLQPTTIQNTPVLFDQPTGLGGRHLLSAVRGVYSAERGRARGEASCSGSGVVRDKWPLGWQELWPAGLTLPAHPRGH